MSTATIRWSSLALSVLRIIAALLFMQHGLQKLFLFPAPSPHGTPLPFTIGWFAGAMEVLGGGLLAIGLFTRAVAFVASGEMAIGYFAVHAPVSFFPVLNQGDLAVLFCFVFLFLSTVGAGPLAADRLLERRRRAGAKSIRTGD